MKPETQIHTTIAQAKELVALGLEMETADMCMSAKREEVVFLCTLHEMDMLGFGTRGLIPSWSLHRLTSVIISRTGIKTYTINPKRNPFEELIEIFKAHQQSNNHNKYS